MELNIQTVSKNGIKLGRPRLGEGTTNVKQSEYAKAWRAKQKVTNPNFLAEQNERQKQYYAANKARCQEIMRGTQLRQKIRQDLAKEFFKTDI